MHKTLFSLMAVLVILLPVGVFAANSAVIFMYHRFGESKHPSTNIKIKQFEKHLKELKKRQYSVRSIPEILKKITSNQPLPPQTIGISIDDAFLSVFVEAWPRLRQLNFPFTLFVATNPLDQQSFGYMSWNQLRKMVKAGVTVGSQTASHLHMPVWDKKRNKADLKKSNNRFKTELGFIPKLIAYPYGEYSLRVGEITKAAGFEFGFGQHSGVLHKSSNFMYLPRFSFNEKYGDLGRLRIASGAVPLEVSDIIPLDPFLRQTQNPPLLGFTVTNVPKKNLSNLSCYASGQGKVHVKLLGKRRIEVRMKKLPPGRTRVNCTLQEKQGRWKWYGMQFLMRKPSPRN
ncbi:MAG: polysaccharide deacetylase family protein [Pseudomonadota bacterium]|nr:polysaccharide deacetylase family protein [Pseudomonadota bacterium]